LAAAARAACFALRFAAFFDSTDPAPSAPSDLDV
jgi:hypothetical protein